jgi:hypothetical protein
VHIANMVLVLDVITSVRCSVELPGQKAPYQIARKVPQPPAIAAPGASPF